jgi:CBS domain-containing protein
LLGAPEDLLNASIFFDLRPVAGDHTLADALRQHIATHAAKLPRFIKQLALNALHHRPPLNWRGRVETHEVDHLAVMDLKLQGTAVIVDTARIYALSLGVVATNTRERLEAVGLALALPERDTQAWIAAFEFLQSLRLRIQMDSQGPFAQQHPNLLPVDTLNSIDQRVLRDALRLARQLQQRLELDYQR